MTAERHCEGQWHNPQLTGADGGGRNRLPKILSVHTPKAGGTSVYAMLRQTYGSAIRLDGTEDPVNPMSMRHVEPDRYFSRNATFPPGVRCIHGHLHPGGYKIEDDTILFTILREPIDNIISIHFFWKKMPRQGSHLHDYFLDRNLSLLDTASLWPLRYIYSNSYFGGFDMSRFNIIGSHENRTKSLERLSRLAAIDLDVSLMENVTAADSERSEIETDTKLRAKLGDILAEDIRFYEKHVMV